MYAVTAFLLKVLHTILSSLFPRKRQIILLSRQSNHASLDFSLLKDCLKKHMPDWDIAESFHSRQTLPSIVRDVFLVATSRVCILDGYSPAVSIPKIGHELLVIQLWHALGAIKRFGWQAVGLKSGRPENMAKSLSMHANYSAVIAAGEGCIPAYMEAFRCSHKAVVALGLPRMDYLLDLNKPALHSPDVDSLLKDSGQTAEKTSILYVPTFRERQNDAVAIETCLTQLTTFLPTDRYSLIVSTHPFSSDFKVIDNHNRGISSPQIQSIDLLHHVDYVITDYSAITFEAALVQKKVLFYVPDIDTYRATPGLNIDVEEEFPLISFRSAEALARFVNQDLIDDSYRSSGFWEYCDNYLIKNPSGSTERIVRYIKDRVI